MVSPAIRSLPDLVEPAGRLELELLLVDVLREQKAALAGRDHRPLDDLHPIEGLLERLEVGPHVVEEEQIGVGGLAGDPVLQELERLEGILVEVLPERIGGRPGHRGRIVLVDGLLVEDGLGVLEVPCSTCTIWRTCPFSLATDASARARSLSVLASRRALTALRSFSRARSIVFPEVTRAPLIPIGTTDLTLGTLSSEARTWAKSSSWEMSGSPIIIRPMTSRGSLDLAL